MAGKQQELKSVISVYGKADGSLDTLAKKIKSFGDNVSKIGGAMTMMTAPIIAAIKTSTSLYTDYDDILRKIQAAGNYSPKQMQTIGDAAQTGGRRHKVYGQRCGKRIFIADTGRRATGKQS